MIQLKAITAQNGYKSSSAESRKEESLQVEADDRMLSDILMEWNALDWKEKQPWFKGMFIWLEMKENLKCDL